MTCYVLNKIYFSVKKGIHSSRCAFFFFPTKKYQYFISSRKHMLWYSLEAPLRHFYWVPVFSWRNKKKNSQYPFLSGAMVLVFNTLGTFRRRHFEIFFLIFSRKQDMKLHANYLLGRQFAWSVKSYFLGNKKKIFKVLSAEIFTQHAVLNVISQ